MNNFFYIDKWIFFVARHMMNLFLQHLLSVLKIHLEVDFYQVRMNL